MQWGLPAVALPLGELSPQVTERGLQLALNCTVNLCAHAAKLSVDFPVGKPQNLQTQSRQKCGTFRIICHTLRLKMLRAIYLYNQLRSSAVKIYNEFSDNPLFVNFYWVFAEK